MAFVSGLLLNKLHLMPQAALEVLNSYYFHENLRTFTKDLWNFRFVSYGIVFLPLIAHDACYTFAQVII